MSDESKIVSQASHEATRSSVEQNQLSISSRPSSARRKSWLPANTRDPVVREPWCSEIVLVLKAVDEHLTSGFDVAYPPSLAPYCSATVWADFIKDINKAAKLKRKHKFVLTFRPMVSRVRVIRNAINAKLDKRTKPMLMMLNYWQDILKTYGLRAELRKGGQSIDKRLITPPPTSVDLRHSGLFTSGHSSISSSRSMCRSSIMRGSTSDLQEFGPIRPPYLQSNSSRASLTSHGSFAFGDLDTSLSGNWELVLYSYKKRSEMRAMYRRSRRYSSMSTTGSPRSGRPTTAMMLGDELSTASTRSRRQSRAKMLTLEDLAKLPLPVPRSPFNPSDQTSSKKTIESSNTSEGQSSDKSESNADVDSCKSPRPSGQSIDATTEAPQPAGVDISSPENVQGKYEHTTAIGECPPLPENPDQSIVRDESIAPSDVLNCSISESSPSRPGIKISISGTLSSAITSQSPDEAHDISTKQDTLIGHNSSNNLGIDIGCSQRPDSMTHSPLSSIAKTAQRMSADLDEAAEALHRSSVHKLSKRFSVSNFLQLASSVLTKSNKDEEVENDMLTKTSPPVINGKPSEVIQQKELCAAQQKNPRPPSSSFMTVVATPVQPEKEILDATTERPLLRVMTSQPIISGHGHDIPEVKSLLKV